MRNDYVVYIHKNILNGKVYVGQTCNLSERWRNNGKNYFNSIKFYNAIKKYGWDNFTHEVVYSNLNKQAADKLEKELIHKYNSIEEGYNLKEGGSRGELSTKSLAKMSESLKRGYSDRTRARYNLALSFCIYNKYLICACKVIYLLYCMGVKFYITLHCLIIS